MRPLTPSISNTSEGTDATQRQGYRFQVTTLRSRLLPPEEALQLARYFAV